MLFQFELEVFVQEEISPPLERNRAQIATERPIAASVSKLNSLF